MKLPHPLHVCFMFDFGSVTTISYAGLLRLRKVLHFHIECDYLQLCWT